MSEDIFPSAVAAEPHFSFVPVMIARLLLSLKKAGASQEGWSLGEPTISTMGFAEGRGGVTTRDEIHLDTLGSTHERVHGQV